MKNRKLANWPIGCQAVSIPLRTNRENLFHEGDAGGGMSDGREIVRGLLQGQQEVE